MADPSTQNAVFHSRLRWVGAPLLISGVIILLWAVTNMIRGGSGWLVLVSMLGCGLSLASFGANHDTAMALALEARQTKGAPGLPETLANELEEEMATDRAELMSLRPTQTIGKVIPLIAILIQAGILWQLVG